MLISRFLEEAAEKTPDRIAVRTADAAITYGSLADQVARLASGYAQLGLAPGQRMAVLLPNSAELAATALAAWRRGLILVALSGQYAPPQQADILAETGARVLVTSAAWREAIPAPALEALCACILTDGEAPGCVRHQDLLGADARPVEGGGPDPLGLVVHTSGTTGRPRGTVHTQARLAARTEAFVRQLSLTADDVALGLFAALRPVSLVPLLLAMLRVGGCTWLAERTGSSAFWRLYGQTRPTYSLVMPSYLRTLLDDPAAPGADHSRLRFLLISGDQAGPELDRRTRALTGRPLLNVFGATQTGAILITPPEGARKPGAAGKPMDGVEVRLAAPDGRDAGVDEPGRLLVRSPTLMAGYWNDTLGTHTALASGWFDTQDVMKADADGFYWFLGRAADVIVRNAVNVSSALIVDALAEHPAVAEAAVVGITDPAAGQAPVAFYRLRAAADPGPERLLAWVAARVDSESAPIRILKLDQFPLTPQGKLDRALLVRLAEEDAALGGRDTNPEGPRAGAPAAGTRPRG